MGTCRVQSEDEKVIQQPDLEFALGCSLEWGGNEIQCVYD